MINIFNYLDYRQYLTDFYKVKKNTRQGFSYQSFADKAGFKDKSCIFSVLNGKRNLNAAGIVKLSAMLGHDTSEAGYFETLVQFNQALDMTEKKLFFEKLCRIKERGAKRISKVQLLRREQFEYYSQWYHIAIRSIIEMYGFKNNYKWLSKMVYPSISEKKAKQSVLLLQKLGLIQKQRDGSFTVPDKIISTGKDVLSFAVQSYHIACADLAKRAIQRIPSDKRNMTSLTMGISKAAYDQICEELQAFQSRAIAIAENDQDADSVYQFNFHLFPISATGMQRNKDR